ncbi:MAG: hypothetical protein IJ589_03815 [Lachnospiraceae bacterium]|nr:hypothetical protein [Lachnospiraceae bacterium]
MKNKKYSAILAGTLSCAMMITACGAADTASAANTNTISSLQEETSDNSGGTASADAADATRAEAAPASAVLSKEDLVINETIENSEDGGHAILADGEEKTYNNVQVIKTGEADGDEADFYGENAAVFATNGGTLNLSGLLVETAGTHANGVFSYGEGTTVNISDSYIETSGNCSGGIMTTGGGTMNAENLTIVTSGNSSAAIRSDRGGGVVTVMGGSYTTSGKGSPAIYSTADITVSDATLTSTSSQGVVVEGNNSVTLNNVDLTADNNTKNSDHSDFYQAVMIYQSMSGDADEGLSSFTMRGGSLLNKNGEIFFVTNTATDITLEDVSITNEGDDVFLRASAAGWGSDGSNGGQVNLYCYDQILDGDMLVDEISKLNLYLQGSSVYSGAINPDGEEGEVYVEIAENATWILEGDSYITSLTCDADSIDLNGHTLYVNGTVYEEGTRSEGEALEITMPGGNGGMGGERPDGMPDGKPGEGGPEGGAGGPGGDGSTPPDMNGEGGPEGGAGGPGGDGSTPPAKPDSAE